MSRTLSIAALAAALAVAPAFAAQDHDAMNHGQAAEQADQCSLPMGEGVINSMDIKKSKVNITHKPIELIGWPVMTMDFKVLKPVDLSAFGAGENVHFALKQEKDKTYAIAAMCSLDVAAGAHEACMTQMHKTAMAAAAEADASCVADDMNKMDHSGHH